MEEDGLLKSHHGRRSSANPGLLYWANAWEIKLCIFKTNIFGLFETAAGIILNNTHSSTLSTLIFTSFWSTGFHGDSFWYLDSMAIKAEKDIPQNYM